MRYLVLNRLYWTSDTHRAEIHYLRALQNRGWQPDYCDYMRYVTDLRKRYLRGG
jgi:hypothetical protein